MNTSINKTYILAIVLAVISIAIILSSSSKSKSNSGSKIVLYYANWCGHSKTFLPAWDCEEETKNEKTITPERILCENDERKKCTFLNGFPTVIAIKDNEIIPFQGDRTFEELKTFSKSI